MINKYEASRLNYLEGISALENARYEGMIEGEQKGKLEGKIEAHSQTIIKCYKKGMSIEEIADFVEEDIQFVNTIIEKWFRDNQK